MLSRSGAADATHTTAFEDRLVLEVELQRGRDPSPTGCVKIKLIRFSLHGGTHLRKQIHAVIQLDPPSRVAVASPADETDHDGCSYIDSS